MSDWVRWAELKMFVMAPGTLPSHVEPPRARRLLSPNDNDSPENVDLTVTPICKIRLFYTRTPS